MTDHHLHDLLEEASADVPRRDLAAAALAGARRRRVRRRSGALAAVAVVGVSVGAVVQGPSLLGDGDSRVAGETQDHERQAENAPVADDFTCPDTIAVPAPDMPEIYGSGPDLGVGNLGADRYEIVTEGDRQVLKVGGADGDLRARVELLPGTDSPRIGAYERCTGPQGDDVPTEGRYELGAHGRPIPDPPADVYQPSLVGPELASSVVKVDDRAFFNRVGVVNRRTIYAYETPTGAGFTDVERGQVSGSVSWDRTEGALDALGPNFIPMGDPEPRENGFAGWTYYATEPVVLTGRLSDGSTVEAETFRADDWKGTIHVVLAPLAELEQVTLEKAGKETQVYSRDDL